MRFRWMMVMGLALLLAAGCKDKGKDDAKREVKVDASTPEGVMKGFCTCMKDGNLHGLAGLMVDEQQAPMRSMADAMEKVKTGQDALAKAWEDKFPDDKTRLDQMKLEMAKMPGPESEGEVRLVEVKVDPDDENLAMAKVEMVKDDETNEEEVTLKKIDGKWRIYQAELGDQDQIKQMENMAKAMGGMGDGLSDVADRIKSGEIASPEDAEKAMQEVMEQMMSAMFSGMLSDLAPPQ